MGCDDFDQAIIQYWEKNQQLIIPTEYKEKNTLRQFAEKAKIFANQNGYFSGTYNNQNLELNTDILNEILEPFISKTITCCKNAMNDSKLKLNEIDAAFMRDDIKSALRILKRCPVVDEDVSLYLKKIKDNSSSGAGRNGAENGQ